MNQFPRVAIVILNWNGWRDTIACVESCRKLSWPNYRMVVVDNGSTDGSEENLRRLLPDAEIIQTGANLGFAGGNNIGIRYALDCGADYVWLLNNDAVADPEALTFLVRSMEHDPGIGIAGSMIYFHDDPRRIWFAGGLWESGRLRFRQRGANQLDHGQFAKECAIGSVSGCSMLVSALAIGQIGLMEEGFFLYWEDTEWCARARKKGYSVQFVPPSRIWHKVSTSTISNSFAQYYYYTRNGFFFLRRHEGRLLPLFATHNFLLGLKCLAVGNVQPLQGLACGLMDFIKGKMGPMMPKVRHSSPLRSAD